MKHKIARRQALKFGFSTLLSTSFFGSAFAQTPKPADKTPPKLEDYAKTPLISEISISPDAQKIAIVSQIGDNKTLYQINRKGNERYSFNLGNAKIRRLHWGSNDHVIILSSQTAQIPQFGGFKAEFYSGAVIEPKTGKFRLLFDKEPDRYYRFVMDPIRRLKIGDQYHISAANYDMSPRRDNYCIDIVPVTADTPNLAELRSYREKNKSLTCIESNAYYSVIEPNGRPFALCDFNDETKRFSVSFNTSPLGKFPFFKEVYADKFPIETPELIGIGRDGIAAVLYMPDEQGGNYVELSPAGKLSQPLFTGRLDHDFSPLFHPQTFRLAGFAEHDDAKVFHYFDPLLKSLAEALPKTMGEDYRSYIVEYAEDPRHLIAYVEGADDAGSYYYCDFTTGETSLLGGLYPQIAKEWLTEKQKITYKASDGLDIPAYLTLPPHRTAKDLPLVVLVHGGPESRDRQSFDWQAQALASRGYAVLQANFRGSGGYGQAFVNRGHGEMGRKMQTDLSDGVRHLVSKGLVNAKRVAIMGASYGGYAALCGATIDHGVYRCAISIAGTSDLRFKLQEIRDRSYNKFSNTALYWERYYGDKSKLDGISPVAQASKASVPILLIHGKQDSVVTYAHSERMHKALKAAGKAVEFLSIEGQDHWDSYESGRIDMIKTAVTFLEKHNPP